MANALGRRRVESFNIHEDEPLTEDTEMNEDAVGEERNQEYDDGDLGEVIDDLESNYSESSDEEVIGAGVQSDMDKLQNSFPGFRLKYRLIKRIGEGTFSTVYKAEDLQYDRFENGWDMDKENEKWTPPPLKRHTSRSSSVTLDVTSQLPSQRQAQRRRPKFIAIKKIYVTSSPTRILNELELLHDLRNCPSICPLITAFRHTDQVIAILPYFRHSDFREYFRKMTVPDIVIYLRSLFSALAAVHEHGILHRDIKPTNFLYDPSSQHGVLVDFGLAEREGYESKPCLCHEEPSVRKNRLRAHVANAPAAAGPQPGYPKNDTRPSRRANRAGTRGFRAPEVLFKCTEQTVKIDVWSVGVILLTILSKRFPFFNSADDVEAMIEIATIFGTKRMRAAGQLHGCMFETNIPTIGSGGFTLEKIVLWSTCRTDDGDMGLDEGEKLAVAFLERCLELDPRRRISAPEALQHEFLRVAPGHIASIEDDEMDMLKV